MPERSRKVTRPQFYDAPVGGRELVAWAQDLGAGAYDEPTPYADLPWAEPLAGYVDDAPEPVADEPGRPYERPVWHPNAPEFREAAIRFARREMEREVAYNVGAGDAESARIVWCDDVLPECWPDEREAWCDMGHDPFGSDGDWAWCNEGHHAWCLDSGGGWCEFGEDGFWEGADGFWTGEWGEDAWSEDGDDRDDGHPRWSRADNRRLRRAWDEWCQEE